MTGSSAGIGKKTVMELAKHNATVIFACRDKVKTLKVIEETKTITQNNNLVFMNLDLSDFDSVKSFSVEFHRKFNKLN